MVRGETWWYLRNHVRITSSEEGLRLLYPYTFKYDLTATKRTTTTGPDPSEYPQEEVSFESGIPSVGVLCLLSL